MLSSFIIQLLPVVCLAGLSISNVLSFFFEMYSKRGLGSNSSEDDVCRIYNTVTVSTIAIFMVYFVASGSSLGSAKIVTAQTTIFLVLLLVSAYFLVAWKNHVDTGAATSIIAVQSVLLLKLSNMVALFFLLELLNAVILYTMLWSSSYWSVTNKQSSARAVNTITYQFVLNFFSSIILFFGINSVISLTGSSDLRLVSLCLLSEEVRLYVSLVLFAFLLKFGTGPWVFFKVNIYRGLNLSSILVYSVVYLSLVFSFYLNLFAVYGLSLNGFSRYLIIAVSALASIVFSGFAFQVPNLFVFLSFSSLLNLTIFLAQLLVAVS